MSRDKKNGGETNSYTTLTDAIADGYAIEKHALTVQLTADDARGGGSEGVAKPACSMCSS